MKTDIPSYLFPLVGFNPRKAAQMCSFFASKEGKMIDKLKLIKLVYLSEREFLHRHHFPMLFDEMYSLPHGPICSSTLNCIDGNICKEEWEEFVKTYGQRVGSNKRFSRDELDEISDAEMDVLNLIWTSFGHLTASGLRNYTHQNCAEYTETDKKRIPISYKSVLEALGEDGAEEVESVIREFRRSEGILAG